MGVFSSYTGKIFFPNWRIFFSQLEKKKAESCKLAFLAAPSHPHTYIHVHEANEILFPNDVSFEPVFSAPAFHQLPFVQHSLQQRVERVGRYSIPFTRLKGLATGEVERQQIQECLLRRFLLHGVARRKERQDLTRMQIQRFRE